jgi:hypothetical protein
MAACIVCGTESEHSFDILFNGGILHFDTFECAIHRLAPACGHCGCKVIGHAVTVEGARFCCTACAQRFQGIESDAPPAEAVSGGTAD